jgi:hypothetical protein
MVPKHVLQLLLVKNHKIDNTTAAAEAREKIEHLFGIIKILEIC